MLGLAILHHRNYSKELYFRFQELYFVNEMNILFMKTDRMPKGLVPGEIKIQMAFF